VTRKWLLPVGLIVLLVVGVAMLWHTGVLHRISNKDQLIALLREGGPTGALWCIAVQFLQVVIAAIPGEITSFAAGYVFGAWRGFLYSAIGVTLGSASTSGSPGWRVGPRWSGSSGGTGSPRSTARSGAPGASRRCFSCFCSRVCPRTS